MRNILLSRLNFNILIIQLLPSDLQLILLVNLESVSNQGIQKAILSDGLTYFKSLIKSYTLEFGTVIKYM